MATILIELTNRCNLACKHCVNTRHRSDGDLQIEILAKVLNEAREHGVEYISYTGGEPTMHPQFESILKMTAETGITFGFVSNGWNFTEKYKDVLPFLDRFAGVTFSLDGASEETHDRLRGKGSFQKLMSAVSICVAKGIPFTFNTLITKNIHHEIKEIADLAAKLGSRGLRFGHLIPTPSIAENELDFSPDDFKNIDSAVKQIARESSMPVYMAPGHYTSDPFPCDPLKGREINIDWNGNVTMCCHLSGFGDNNNDRDIIGNLDTISFAEAYERFISLNKKYHEDKTICLNKHDVADTDYFPCWYCLNYFGKIDWLKAFPQNPWYDSLWKDNDKRTEIIDDKVESKSKA